MPRPSMRQPHRGQAATMSDDVTAALQEPTIDGLD